MIPDLVDVGGPWLVLPPGIHKATHAEAKARFATSNWRQQLFDGFEHALNILLNAGCSRIFLDGSYVTDKPTPRDYDACWDVAHVDDLKLDPIFFDFDNERKNQKQRYLGELFPVDPNDPSDYFLNAFQLDQHTGSPKGIIQLDY